REKAEEAADANKLANNLELATLAEAHLILHPFMSSLAIGYDALEATTNVEDITEISENQDILRSLKNDELPALRLLAPGQAKKARDYEVRSSRELGWLGHFMKKSTRLESFGMYGYGADTLNNCSEESVNRFFGDLSNLEELYIDCELINYGYGLDFLNDGMVELESIPSLTTCKGIRTLTLNGLHLSINSCALLSVAFPRMAALLELHLSWNSFNDYCTRILAQGLSECKQILSLDLSRNRISDDGLDVLIQGLPASVDALNLEDNEITLARQLPLLRFKELDLCVNTLCLGGPGVIAASLANPECRLEELQLTRCNIGSEGAAIIAPSLRGNQKLTRLSLDLNDVTEEGWNAFSSILCDTSSINATYNSNHTLRSLGFDQNMSPYTKMFLKLNHDQDKGRVAANKILQVHRHLDMKSFFGRELDLLPRVVAWLDRFAESRPDLKLSSIFEFVRAMPMKVTGEKRKTEGKKCKLSN
ncbi:hypothetical protein THAOC_08092, partial [Thalassiosira oceanica]